MLNNQKMKMKLLFRTASMVFLVLALSSCNTVRLSYNNAQELTYWWLNSYVDFSAEQKPVIKSELETLHAWHRFNEIPVYIQILQSAQSKVTHDITGRQACVVAESVRERFRMLNLQLEPIIEKLAPTLTHQQLANIQKHYERKNEKWRKDWLEGSQQERDEHRLKLAVKRAEMLYGDLDDRQVAILKKNIRTSVFNPDISYSEKLRRQEDAIATLRKIIDKKLKEPDIKMEIAAYFDRFQNGDDLAYKNYIDRMTVDACDGFARLHNSTNPAQRKHAAEKLAGYIADLKTLKTSAQLKQ